MLFEHRVLFENVCWRKLKEHIKIRELVNFQRYISKVAIAMATKN